MRFTWQTTYYSASGLGEGGRNLRFWLFDYCLPVTPLDFLVMSLAPPENLVLFGSSFVYFMLIYTYIHVAEVP